MIKKAFIFCCLLCTISLYGQDSLLISYGEANSFFESKEYEKAVEKYDQLLPVFINNKKWTEVLSIFNKKGILAQKKYEYKKGEDLFFEGLNLIADTSLVKPLVLAETYHKIGLSFLYQNKYIDSKNYFSKGLKIRLKEQDKNPNEDLLIKILWAYRNLGECEFLLENYDEAIENLNFILITEVENDLLKALTYKSLIQVFRGKGNTAKAKSYIDKCAVHYKALDNPRLLANFYYSMANFHLNIYGEKNKKKAIELTLKSIELLKSLDLNEKNKVSLSRAYNALGLAYEDLGEFSKSKESLRQAITYCGGCYDLRGYYNDFGMLLVETKEYEEAIAYLNKAIFLHKKNENLISISRSYDNLGDAFFKKKNYYESLNYYHQALTFLLPDFKSQEIETIPNLTQCKTTEKINLLTYLNSKAKTHHKIYQTKGEENHLNLAYKNIVLLDQFIDQTRHKYRADMSKGEWVTHTKKVYENAIQICFSLYDVNKEENYRQEAFRFAEKSKAIILLESLQANQAQSFAGLDKKEIQRERSLKREMAFFESEIYHTKLDYPDSLTLIQSLSDSLIAKQESLETFADQLENKYPKYKTLKEALNIESVSSIQQSLEEDQLMLEYFLGEDQLFVFAIKKDQFDIKQLPIDFDIRESISRLRSSIDIKTMDKIYAEEAFKLYNLLIENQKELLTEKLIIIPDDILGLLPFDLLLTNNVEKDELGKYRDYPFLIINHSVSYCYSATMLAVMSASKKNEFANKGILAFAPSFDFSKAIALNRKGMSSLLYNEQEVESIGQLTKTTIFKSKEATKNNFLSHVNKYPYVHISSHGLANDEDPDYSFVAFTQKKEKVDTDELLYVKEIYAQPIQSEMLVLSACETAVGEIKKGEGIMSLSRAFSYAGVKSLITSLWSVNDQKTADLMTHFYQNLQKKSTSKDAALQAAKLQLINESDFTANPYFWAAFIPIGNMQPINLPSPYTLEPFYNEIGSGLAMFLILGLYFFIKRMTTQKKSNT